MVYFAVVLTIAIIWFLYRTRAGLVLRSVGESPNRRMRWVIRYGVSVCWRCSLVARCADWRGLIWR